METIVERVGARATPSIEKQATQQFGRQSLTRQKRRQQFHTTARENA